MSSSTRMIPRGARYFLWNYGTIYDRLLRWRYPCHPLSYQKPFWIGGFPRSGNTFAGVLLESTLYPGDVDYQIHTPTQLIKRARSGTSGFIVLRDPKAACVSWAIYRGWPLRRPLQDYIDFHSFLLGTNHCFFVAQFSLFTESPQRLIDGVIKSFDLPKTSFEVTESLLQTVASRIEGKWAKGSPEFERQVARPSESRLAMRAALEAQLNEDADLKKLLGIASTLYRQCLARWHALETEMPCSKSSNPQIG